MGTHPGPLVRVPVIRYWTCPCGTRNERVKRKCAGEGCNRSRPKPRVPKHAETLRDDTFEVYRELNALIHGPAFDGEWSAEDCGCCGKKPTDARNLDRDHGHDQTENSYGKPRGLACPGDWGCNKVMAKLTLERARLIVAYLERVDNWYASEEAGDPSDLRRR